MNGAAGGATAASAGCVVNSSGCATSPKPVVVTAPAAGGAGGQGASGSAGASGAGGDSFAYYAGGGAAVTVAPVAVLSFGKPGTSPGPVPGSLGVAGRSN
jgi:hypothetical protein